MSGRILSRGQPNVWEIGNMKASLIALVLVTVSCEALAQGVQDWRLCRAVDADHLVIPACTQLIESSNLSQGNRAVAYAIRGAAHWRQRDFDKAIADENDAIAINPRLSGAYVTRGAAYGNKGDDDQALADASKAIEIDPNNAAAYSNRAIARGNKGDLDNAIADATRGIEIDPQSANGYAVRGDLHARNREPGPAYADFGKGDRNRAHRRLRRLPGSRQRLHAQE
jgi:tetratricopeptide (TPR) repeat protein